MGPWPENKPVKLMTTRHMGSAQLIFNFVNEALERRGSRASRENSQERNVLEASNEPHGNMGAIPEASQSLNEATKEGASVRKIELGAGGVLNAPSNEFASQA